jgi:hypothetical protein
MLKLVRLTILITRVIMEPQQDPLDRFVDFANRHTKMIKYGSAMFGLTGIVLAVYTVLEVRSVLNAQLETQQLIINNTPTNQAKVLNKFGIDAKPSADGLIENKEAQAFDVIVVGEKSISFTAKKDVPYSLTQFNYQTLASIQDPKQVLKFKTINNTISPSTLPIKGEFQNTKFSVKPVDDCYEVTNTSDKPIILYSYGLVKRIKFSPDGKNVEVLATQGTPTSRSYVIAGKDTIKVPFTVSTMNPNMTFNINSEIMFSEDLEPVK